MGALGVVSLLVVVGGAGVTAVCVALVEWESRRLAATTRRLAAVVAGSRAPGITR